MKKGGFVLKDSGSREEFQTGSRRDTNRGKPRYDLISPIALYSLAMQLSRGAEKYGERNWEKGQPLGRYLESAERHLQKLKVGLTDEDHGGAVLFNIMAFLHTKYLIEQGELPQELYNLSSYPEEFKKLLAD